jgi:hypothetical protein
MKKGRFVLLAVCFLLIAATGCEKQEDKTEQRIPPTIAADCPPEDRDFRFTYNQFVTGQADYCFMKGKVLDTIPCGLNINLMEDLKGNFPLNSPVTIWFGGDAGLTSTTRGDRYKPTDTLLIICRSAAEYGSEYSRDMVMPICYPSVLQVLGEYVSGYIYDPYRKDTVLWNGLLENENATIRFGDAFTVKINESVTLTSENEETLIVGFKKILNDGRCYLSRCELCCFSRADIQISITDDKKTADIDLSIWGCIDEENENGYAYTDTLGYRIRLLRLDPYPIENETIYPSDYRSKLKITKLSQ